jgi:ABC-type multidrug transport system ATPase subunit
MDPLSRRAVWRHIDEIKKGRVVLLTTHAMEEADLLADIVAVSLWSVLINSGFRLSYDENALDFFVQVMRKGELAAYGTPLELKSKYGSPLQFTLLVDKENVRTAQDGVLSHFKEFYKDISFSSGDAGNITVKIGKIKRNDDKEGVDVVALADFVGWLDDRDTSGVKEWGFSNSSLEEVFLKVTQGDGGDQRPVREAVDTYSCCCLRRNAYYVDDENEVVGAVQAVEVDTDKIAAFHPMLSTWKQAVAILYFSSSRHWVRKWTGWFFHAFLVVLALTLTVRANNTSAVPFMVGPVCFLSMTLITLVSPIYRDRSTGLFYLMKAQGLLKSSYIFGYGLYSFLVQFLFGLVMLTAMYLPGLFRDPFICGDTDSCEQQWSWNRRISGGFVIDVEDPDVYIYATWKAGGYGMLFGAAFMFALTAPGAVFASAYVPGHKLALVLVATACLLAGIFPIITYFLVAPRFTDECVETVCDTTSNEGLSFLNCIGAQVNADSLGSLCMPSYAAMLPQLGLFHMIAASLLGNILFVSDPPDYATSLFIPSLGSDVQCDGNVCEFPFAREQYLSFMGFMAIGALILMLMGFCFVSLFSFPNKTSRQLRSTVKQAWNCISMSKIIANVQDTQHSYEILQEVVDETAVVESFVRRLIDKSEAGNGEEDGFGNEPLAERSLLSNMDDLIELEVNTESISRDSIPPVLSYNLRKVYPSLGGAPPRVALQSLDLHVPRGEVLGLLGKNGAG